MFSINVTLPSIATPALVVFSKFFDEGAVKGVLDAIPGETRKVIFIDTPATPHMVRLVEVLLERGVEVVVRDHHDEPNPCNPRAQEIAAAAAKVRELVGAAALISDRRAHPACSSLIKTGEFVPGVRNLGCYNTSPESREVPWSGPAHDSYFETCEDCVHYAVEEAAVIVADPDPDGLTAAMKGLGVVYPALDKDAAVLDGPRAAQTAESLSDIALLLVRAMSALPAFDAARPEISNKAKGQLFSDFVALVQGDEVARARLEKSAEQYEAGVREAERLSALVVEPFPGLATVDLTLAGRFDLGTLSARMEARTGVKVTAQVKSQGPIASKHGGVQVSLAVVKAHQATINLQELVPQGTVSSPESGVISNTTFLLHVSQKWWDEVILPALRAKLNG